MKIRDYKILIRKSHRYLGIFIGIQFLLWTVSGLFFSWTNIDEIHGDHLREDRNSIKSIAGTISPDDIQSELLKIDPNSLVTSFRIVNFLDTNYYEVVWKDKEKKKSTILFSAETGQKRGAVTQQEAEKIAGSSLVKNSKIIQTEYLTKENVGSHHEYREKPLPAWAVSFDHPEGLTVYLSASNGQVQSFRTNNWRVFDFLWMLHTMDFIGRDDINNWALRIFSLLSIVMIISGYLYFLITARKPW